MHEAPSSTITTVMYDNEGTAVDTGNKYKLIYQRSTIIMLVP